MKMKIGFSALLLLGTIFYGMLQAQAAEDIGGIDAATESAAALVPLPSVFDFTRGSGWGVALGVGVEFENAYDGSDEYEVGIEPVGALQWRTGNHLLFWEGNELGWRSRVADVWLVQAGLRYEGGRESDDSDEGRLDGLDDRDSEIVGMAEVRRSLSGNWRNYLAARLMIGDSDIGVLGIIAAGRRFFASRNDGTGSEVAVFSTFGNSGFLNRDFGVTTKESRSSGLAATDLDAGYRSSGITLINRYYLTEKIQLINTIGAELYSGDIRDSPISRENFEIETGLSFVYHF